MGKGSKWRKTDFKKYFDNFDKIKKKKSSAKKGVTVSQSKITYKYE
jgi:hypothetical protein